MATRPTQNKGGQRRTRSRFVASVAGLAILAMLSTGVVVAQDEPELGGTLNFLGYEGEEATEIAADFLSENGITMQPSYVGAADEALTRFQTGGRGQMDIMAANKDFQRSVLDAGIEFMIPLPTDRIPNAAGLWPAFQVAPWVVRDGVMYTVPLIWGDEPVIYNPEKWDGVPDRYSDFADPKYAGEVVMLDDPFTNIWLFAKTLGFEDPSRLTQEQLDQVVEAMLLVKPNVVAYGASLGDMVDIMVRGEASMGIGGWAGQIPLAAEKGVELKVQSPAVDGTFFWSDAYSIALDAPNVDNALAFIDFMMTPEANAAIASALGSAVTIEAAYDLLSPEDQALFPYDVVRAEDGGVLNTQIVIPPQEPEGDIVGTGEWADAWQVFKLS